MSFWIVPESWACLPPAPRPRRCRRPLPEAPPRSSSSRRSSCRAGSRRTGSSCPRACRSPPPPCRRPPTPGDGRCRSPGGWRDRKPPTAPSARPRGCAGRRRSNPPRSRSPHIAGSSRAGRCTSRHRARGCRARSRAARGRFRRHPRSCRAAGPRSPPAYARRCPCPSPPSRRRPASRIWSVSCRSIHSPFGLSLSKPSIPIPAQRTRKALRQAQGERCVRHRLNAPPSGSP
jgi:hypothetical protein